MSANRLGRGLEALIRPADDQPTPGGPGVALLPLTSITPNPNQPRQQFDPAALDELAASIKEKGVLTPITVRHAEDNNHYLLVAGERRWRAAKQAGLKEIPAFIVDVSDDAEMMEMALIENIQRENLNPIEEAQAYAYLTSKFNLSQAKIAKAVGKKRVTITNSLRLLTLPTEVKQAIKEGRLSAGHGRAILMMKTQNAMQKVFRQIINNDLSVRASEALAKTHSAPPQAAPKKVRVQKSSPQVRVIEDELIALLGTKVKIKSGKDRGTIEITYFSNEDLDRILELIRSIS